MSGRALGFDTHAGIRYSYAHVAPRQNVRVLDGGVLVQPDVVGTEAQLPPDGIASRAVEGQVHERLSELLGVDIYHADVGSQVGDQLDVLSQGAAQERNDLRDQSY